MKKYNMRHKINYTKIKIVILKREIEREKKISFNTNRSW